ncbi:MAG: FAD binding domain-containing protein [Podila humilis]|nr:MAG: FAD binding domain-containing protein [Podila humilis]
MSNSNSSTNSISSSDTPIVDASTLVQEIPVLIVGAGPVGLFEALLLTKMGIRVRVIERDTQISPLSRALGTQARSLEIFGMVEDGFVDKFLSEGRILQSIQMFYGSRPMCNIPFDKDKDANSRYYLPLFMEQEKVSKVLEKELAEKGVQVEYGWELTDTEVVGEEETHVKTVIRQTVAPSEGQRELRVVQSEYLIGSDGGRSTVRHKANIRFPGRTLPYKFIMFDGTIDTDLDLQDGNRITGVNHKTLIIFRIRDNQYRIVIEDGHYEPDADLDQIIRDQTIEEFEGLVRAALHPGTKFKVIKSLWLTCYRVNERRADNYLHKGRIFLAGDAAHVHSPAGGQGMNTGLQDAHNLAWKLGLVMNKLAPATLLQSYQDERVPMADRAIALSSSMILRGRDLSLVGHYINRMFLMLSPLLIYFRSRFFPRSANMLEIRYPANDINIPHKVQEQPKVEEHQVGARAPDGPLLSSDNNKVHVHQLTVGVGKFHVLVFAGNTLADPASSQECEKELAKHVEEHVSQWRSRWHFTTLQDKADNQLFKIHIIAAGTGDSHGKGLLAKCARGDGHLFWDSSAEVHASYGVVVGFKNQGSIVVIRPDSHIGYRVQGLDEGAWADVNEYFQTILA